MSDPKAVGLPYPFRACEKDPYYNVEVGPKEWVRVVTGAAYDAVVRHLEDQLQGTRQELDRFRVEYAALEAEHRRLTEASYEQLKAAQTVIDVWRAFGHG